MYHICFNVSLRPSLRLFRVTLNRHIIRLFTEVLLIPDPLSTLSLVIL